jgi:uncharacterized protein
MSSENNGFDTVDEQLIPATPLRTAVYPSLLQAFGLLGLVLLFSMVFTLAFFSFGIDSRLSQLVIYVGSTLLTLVAAIKFRESGFFSFRSIPFVLYPIIVVAVPALILLIEPLSSWIPMPDFVRQMFEKAIQRDIYSVLMVSIAAPILEELLFRGIILDGFLKRFSPLKAILWSSLLFGLIHLNPWQFISAFILGIVIGWLYVNTRSLIPCILLHFLINTTSIVNLFYSNDPWQTPREFIGNNLTYGMMMVLAGVIIVISYLILQKTFKQNQVSAESINIE